MKRTLIDDLRPGDEILVNLLCRVKVIRVLETEGSRSGGGRAQQADRTIEYMEAQPCNGVGEAEFTGSIGMGSALSVTVR